MHPLLKKLNYKLQLANLVLNTPDNLHPLLAELNLYEKPPEEVAEHETLGFALAFVNQKQQLEVWAPLLAEKLEGDGPLWFAYPKSSSKKYKSELSRDHGWETLGKLGFEGVRQISLDDDWTALRFRRVDFIKKMTRRESFALSEAGKTKTKSNKKDLL